MIITTALLPAKAPATAPQRSWAKGAISVFGKANCFSPFHTTKRTHQAVDPRANKRDSYCECGE